MVIFKCLLLKYSTFLKAVTCVGRNFSERNKLSLAILGGNSLYAQELSIIYLSG